MKTKWNTKQKLKIFRDLFSGLTAVYGTYNPATGKVWQVKAKVTERIFLNHLTGKQPYGVYLLDRDRTKAVVVDFDIKDSFPPFEFTSIARHYKLSSYVERSKSKGNHVWIFFDKPVPAYKARLIVKLILDELEVEGPDIEIFPKHDILDTNISYGNFINAPLFGALVPKGKTVFLAPTTFKPYPNQWDFLASVEKVRESTLDEIIEINDLKQSSGQKVTSSYTQGISNRNYSLPPCARQMLNQGVKQFQRISCFRLGVHLKKLGLPYEMTMAALRIWARKNTPAKGTRIITDEEITEQTTYVYQKNYSGYGCGSEAVTMFCDPKCPVHNSKSLNREKSTV